MSYSVDQNTGDIVIAGFEQGIAENPYAGISDMRNVNIISIPGEASVGFSMTNLSPTAIASGTVASVSGSIVTFTGATGLENKMAISFTSQGSYSGFTAGTAVYWVSSISGATAKIYYDYATLNQATITGSGSAGFTVYNPDFSNYQGNQPNKFTTNPRKGTSYMADSKGRVWSNKILTTSNYWTYVGNIVHSGGLVGDASNGNGIVCYPSSTTAGGEYVFIFSDSSIDYFLDNTANTIVYGWNPVSPGSVTSAPYLNSGANSGNSHEALVGQDNVVYYCDGSFLGSFFEKAGQVLDPSSASTYTFAKQALGLPTVDTATCLAELGINLLVGGVRNLIYPWDRTNHVSGISVNSSFSYPIFLAESVTYKMVTVNTNTFLFTGNRGRIYITNGSQAQLYAKVPDHISGTVEPYYQWGGVATNKNQLYFSAKATTNAGTALSTYGGVWAIDMDTKAMRLVNKLSYNTYNGYAPALMSVVPIYFGGQLVGNPTGYGLFAGWDSGASTYGIDGTSSTPYTGGQSIVVSDLIPVGTLLNPSTPSQFEYKLSMPLLSGESVELQVGSSFADYVNNAMVSLGTTSGTGSATTSTIYSDVFPSKVQTQQWMIFKAILTSKSTNPSYVRLTQMRIIGDTDKTQIQNQPFSL